MLGFFVKVVSLVDHSFLNSFWKSLIYWHYHVSQIYSRQVSNFQEIPLAHFIYGSAGFMTDLTFNGGLVGAQIGNQRTLCATGFQQLR